MGKNEILHSKLVVLFPGELKFKIKKVVSKTKPWILEEYIQEVILFLKIYIVWKIQKVFLREVEENNKKALLS